ncbi:ATP-binding protein [Brevundimonas sp.]|jgi:signal transduction histidine kinase|uniref:ATP-binding protein n=1 Tax=Brevundimonas sp. TaxID=1871086 RepID=UPI0037C09213
MKVVFATLGKRMWSALDSVGGRTFVLLTIGISTAAILSITLAEKSRRRDFEAVRLNQLVSRTAELDGLWRRDLPENERQKELQLMLGVRPHDAPPPFRRDVGLERRLEAALGPGRHPMAGPTARDACLPPEVAGRVTATKVGDGFELVLDCWVVSFIPNGQPRKTFAMFQPPFIIPVGSGGNPVYLIVLLAASALLSVLVARFITRPLARLSSAATAFAASLDAPAADARGPTEVRAALSTFNIMQARVREGLRERTQLLAAISHDLQTPLTRLRLRLENVEDEALRERLVADVNATQALVRQGLDLARSQEATEAWSVVDLDSLVESLAEDAAEFGADVRFTAGCGRSARVRPTAIARALNNLIDNGVKYGGRVDVSCRSLGDRVLIDVRDYGPGLGEPDIERLFEPFVRGGASSMDGSRGTGIGLTIARAQAHASGAAIELRNHPGGGLLARLSIPS